MVLGCNCSVTGSYQPGTPQSRFKPSSPRSFSMELWCRSADTFPTLASRAARASSSATLATISCSLFSLSSILASHLFWLRFRSSLSTLNWFSTSLTASWRCCSTCWLCSCQLPCSATIVSPRSISSFSILAFNSAAAFRSATASCSAAFFSCSARSFSASASSSAAFLSAIARFFSSSVAWRCSCSSCSRLTRSSISDGCTSLT
mmetsp:Transcript_10367/g.19634  ORF Transcript_10367/g.19634 Transcript_10367/m.19634 type:complete len:205 (-) Transcript_10367:349-963(-)